jgi:hypothetical protein
MVNRYDDYANRQLITFAPNLTGLSVPGTAASDTVLLRIPVCGRDYLINRLRLRCITGGTAAGPVITVGKSLAGTGAVSAVGTYTFGTQANGAVGSASLTSTTFSENDEIVITNVAGTVASTPAIVFSLAYKDV